MSTLSPIKIRQLIAFYEELGLLQLLASDEREALVDSVLASHVVTENINQVLLLLRASHFYFYEEDYFLAFAPLADSYPFGNIYEKLIFDLASYSKWFFCPENDSIRCTTASDSSEVFLRFRQDGTLYQSVLFARPCQHIQTILELVNQALKARFSRSPLFYEVSLVDGGSAFVLMTHPQYLRALDQGYFVFYS